VTLRSISIYIAICCITYNSRRAEGSFELHTGPVTALAATVSDGGLRLATAGQAAKSLNIFDKNAPRSLHPDSVVRTFDLRLVAVVLINTYLT
jgi:hypothetical protein